MHWGLVAWVQCIAAMPGCHLMQSKSAKKNSISPDVKLLKLRCAAACTPLMPLPPPLLLLLRAGPPSMCCGVGASCGTLKNPSASSNSSKLQTEQGKLYPD